MGLDMYLNKKTYVKRWKHIPKNQQYKVLVRKGGKTDKTFDIEKISSIEEQVMYWRKANHIHSWFVQNVQGGVDDCREYQVSRESLQELLDTCKKVIASSKLVGGKVHNGTSYTKDPVTGDMVKRENYEDGKVIEDPTVASELLPTSSGFFFGNTDYNEWYLQDVIETAKFLEEELAKDDRGDYYYQSSW